MFENWLFWLVVTVAALVGLIVLEERGFRDRVNGSINGQKRWVGMDSVWWEKNFKHVVIAVAIVGLTLMMFGCSSGSSTPAPVATNALCPSVIQGTVDAPPMEDRVKALAIEAQSKGIALTGDYATDVRNQGGEMMLIGTQFKFVFDANCQVDKTQSSLNLFLTDYPVEGGMAPDGSLGMAVDVAGAKVGVKGRVLDGKFVEGEVRKGWLPHIYGVLNGTFTPLVK